MTARRRWDFWNWVLLAVLATLAVLLVWPLSEIFKASVTDNRSGAFTLANYVRVLTQPFFTTALENTLIVGIGGMLGATLLGVPLAVLTTRFAIRGHDLLSTVAALTLVSPPFIGAYAWIMMLGRNGFVRAGLEDVGIEIPSIYGFFGIILVFSLKFYPFVFLLTSASLRTINPTLEEAAIGLGAGPLRRLFKVTLPLVLPAITSGALLTFVLSIADFGTPAIVGGRVRVLATTAFNLFTSEMGGNPGLASTVSALLIAVSAAVVLLQRWWTGRRSVEGAMVKRMAPKRMTLGASIAAHAACYTIAFLGFLPSLVVIWTSLRKTSGPVFVPGFGFDSYTKILREIPQVIGNSALYSLIAVAIITVVGTLVGYILSRRQTRMTGALDAALMVPYLVPGVVLGLAFTVAFNVWPLELTGSATIIVLMLFVRRLPYAVRSSATILRQIRGSIEEAAISLGATPARAFAKVTLPLMLPGIVSGALMSFITAINELSSSLILYVGRTMTMPVRIYLSVLDGDFGTAAALSTILLLATGTAVYAVLWVSGRNESALA